MLPLSPRRGSHEVAGALQKKSSLKGEEKRGRRGEDPTCNADANLVEENSLLIDFIMFGFHFKETL